jgi:hypothetical protein
MGEEVGVGGVLGGEPKPNPSNPYISQSACHTERSEVSRNFNRTLMFMN